MPKRYVLVLIIVALTLFFGIFFLIKLIGGSSNTQKKPTTTTSQKVNKLSNDASEVTYTIVGRTVGEEDHRSIKVTVNESHRKIDILQGYDDHVLSSQSFDNTQSAFKTFLMALESASFTSHDTSIKTDERSVCPLGQKFIYSADYSDGTKLKSWTSSCGQNGASFKGKPETVETLFQNQIPKYDELTSSINL